MDLRLTKSDESFCNYAGAAGIAISAACLIQHLYFMEWEWQVLAFSSLYFLSIIGFVLLIRKWKYVQWYIAVMAFIISIYSALAIHFFLSPLVMILALYLIVITAFIFITELPAKLKFHSIEARKEEDYWKDKI